MRDLQGDFANRLLGQLRGILSALLGIEQRINSINANYESEKEARNKPLVVTATLATPETISVKAETEERKKPWKVALAAFQIIGIIAAIIYAVITFFMWKETIRSSNSAERSIEESRKSRQRSERDASTQFGLLRQQVAAAQDSAKAVNRQTRDENRPWITIDSVAATIQLVVGKEPIAPLRITNVGKTPALSVYGVFLLEPVRNGEHPKLVGTPPRTATGLQWFLTFHKLYPRRSFHSFYMGTLFPEGQGSPALQPIDDQWLEYKGTHILSQAEFDDWNAGKFFLAAQGIVVYRDAFNVSHWTKVCLGLTPLAPYGAPSYSTGTCIAYNDVDGNE